MSVSNFQPLMTINANLNFQTPISQPTSTQNNSEQTLNASLPTSQPPSSPQNNSEQTLNTSSSIAYPSLTNLVSIASVYYDPLTFRQAHAQQKLSYYLTHNGSTATDGVDLSALEKCFDSSVLEFNPWEIEESNPIHNELLKICRQLLSTSKNLPLTNKIAYFNGAISEIVFFCTDTIPKPNLTYPLTPKYELLEIALRNHLYQGWLYQEKSEIKTYYDSNKQKLPKDLNQKELALHNFVTKNNFYYSPNPNMYSILTEKLLEPILLTCVSKATVDLPLNSAIDENEKLITNQLKALQLSQPSHSSFTFNATLRDNIARELITELAIQQYRKEFQEKGTISQNQLSDDCKKLHNFITANNTLISSLNPFFLLVEKTFELQLNNNNPFASVQERISKVKNAVRKPEKKTSLWASLQFGSTQKTMVSPEALANKQEETIAWVEREWWQRLQMPIASAPLIEEIPPPMKPREENSSPEPTPPIYLVFTPPAYINSPLLPESPSIKVITTPEITIPSTYQKTEPPVYPIPKIDPIPTTTINIPTYPSIQPVVSVEVTPPAIIVPHADRVVAVQSLKFQANDPKVPMISYVDIAFKELRNQGRDGPQWSSLPPIVQKDVLRHVHYRPSLKGKAEQLALRIFKEDRWAIYQEATSSNKSDVQAPVTGLQENFVSEGQQLLDFYYSDKIVGQFHNFIQRFQALPKVPLFYQYVYEMAVAANVHIESWDHNFAEYNWDKPGILHLSVQALERCLHTSPKG